VTGPSKLFPCHEHVSSTACESSQETLEKTIQEELNILWRMADGTLGQRMRTARQRAHFSMAEIGRRLAEAINRPEGPFSAQAVQQWEVGTKKKGEPTIPTQPELDVLVAFSQIVGCDLVWLMTGVEPTGGSSAAPERGRVVAIITQQQASQKPIDYASKQTLHTQVECSKRSFAFTVFDRRN
jgi:transcriptional regulator with XRE-family HTH domain